MEQLNKIKEILSRQGRSQAWLAEQMNVSKNAINAMCQNRSQPSLKKLHEISNILDVDICDLLVRTKPTSKSVEVN